MYEKRFYRQWMETGDLNSFRVAVDKSDLYIACDGEGMRDIALPSLRRARFEVERTILRDEEFLRSLGPIDVPPDEASIVLGMAEAGKAWDVGPMAAVAGAIAEAVGRDLTQRCETVIVENGGDVFAQANRHLRFALYAGDESPFRDRVAFNVDATLGIGVCTSSGVVGPSHSFGKADAVVAISRHAAHADAAATSIANQIRSEKDVDRIIEEQEQRGDLLGLIACLGDRLGMYGEIEIAHR